MPESITPEEHSDNLAEMKDHLAESYAADMDGISLPEHLVNYMLILDSNPKLAVGAIKQARRIKNIQDAA
jgi:hypothetical protein